MLISFLNKSHKVFLFRSFLLFEEGFVLMFCCRESTTSCTSGWTSKTDATLAMHSSISLVQQLFSRLPRGWWERSGAFLVHFSKQFTAKLMLFLTGQSSTVTKSAH